MSNSDDPTYIVAKPVTTQPDGTPHCPPWCRLTPHTLATGQVHVVHENQAGVFRHEGAALTVFAFWAEPLNRPSHNTPIVAITRVDGQDLEGSIGVDLAPHQAGELAALLAGLAPEQILRFAASLSKAAALLGYRLDDDGEAL